MEAIEGEPKRFSAFLKDQRYKGEQTIWMLNLLLFEPPPGPLLYGEYGIRAQSKIGKIEGVSSAGKKRSGGLVLAAGKVHALKGSSFDSIGIMCYPSQGAFLEYVSHGSLNIAPKGGGAGVKDPLVTEGFKLRKAGLAVQGLIAMVPERVWDTTDCEKLASRL